MKTLGTIALVLCIAAFYEASEVRLDINRLKRDRNIDSALVTLDWFSAIRDVCLGVCMAGPWGGALYAPEVGSAALESTKLAFANQDIREAGAQYDRLVTFAFWGGALSIVSFCTHFIVAIRSARRDRRWLAELAEKVGTLADRVELSYNQNKNTRSLSNGRAGLVAASVMLVLVVIIGFAAMTEGQRMVAVATDYVRSKMGKDAELLRLRQIGFSDGSVFVISEFSYSGDNGEKILTNWELVMASDRKTVKNHFMEQAVPKRT